MTQKIIIQLPTWLGDSIMTTPALENIFHAYPEAEVTLFGSYVALEALKDHPRITRVVIDTSKKSKLRYFKLNNQLSELGSFDIAFTFKRSLSSKLFLFFVEAQSKYSYKRYTTQQVHLVTRYNDFVNKSLKRDFKANHLQLFQAPYSFTSPTLGINPGATYGSAKRWYPERFAEVAQAYSDKYHIVIFGGPNEADMAQDIENYLKKNNITNYTNLAGKTTVKELIEKIAGLDLFITGDSGPMHVAAAHQIPTIALFGPTKHMETSQWMNAKNIIIRHEINCSPCMKRECPLKTHECMKKITATEVIEAIKDII